jgi:hypothetical protein
MFGAKMKKLNATNAIAVLSLGLIFSVVVAGCGGNDTSESALTKNAALSAPSTAAKSGSSDGGAGGGSTTVAASAAGSSDGGAGGGSTTIAASATGSADGGTGESVTVSDSDLYSVYNGNNVLSVTKVQKLTKVQMNALTSTQWEVVDGLLSASQVASIGLKTIQNLSTEALNGLSKSATQALTDAQLNSMSTEQLNALISSNELTEAQLLIVNTKLGK